MYYLIILRKWEKNNYLWKGTLDFLGINHYNVGYVDISYFNENHIDVLLSNLDKRIILRRNILGWEINPDSMNNILEMINKRYGYPLIMITESGNCEKNDFSFNNQKIILDRHLDDLLKFHSIHKNILGYMWWTLQDNFEWDDGYKPKFGLYKRKIQDNKILREPKFIAKLFNAK